MKQIPLSRGKFALVDDDDFDRLSKHKWYCSANGYACRDISRNGEKTHIWMHREVAQTPDGMFTDHVNGNKSDNRKENLRICSCSENMMNRTKQTNNTSGYKGVFWSEKAGRWRAQITIKRKAVHIGLFDTPELAHDAYVRVAKEHFGKFAGE